MIFDDLDMLNRFESPLELPSRPRAQDPRVRGLAQPPVSPVLPDAPEDPGTGDGFQKFAEFMRIVLPVLASTAAFRNKSLGSFTGGYLGASDRQQQLAMQEDDRRRAAEDRKRSFDLQERTAGRLEREIEARQASEWARERERRQKEEQEKEAQIVDSIRAALDQFKGHSAFDGSLPVAVAEGLIMTVPGLGRINVAEALRRIGVVQNDQGEFLYGQPAPRSGLITGYGPDGKPTRVPDKEGTPVYERPRVPRQEPRPTTRAYTWTDNDPDSETFGKSFRIVEDENGNVTSMKPITSGMKPPSHKADPLGIRR